MESTDTFSCTKLLSGSVNTEDNNQKVNQQTLVWQLTNEP